LEEFERETNRTENVSEMKLKGQIEMMGWMGMEPARDSTGTESRGKDCGSISF
jgi:hypothetical protein